ncbi:hypothetical protein [Actinoplanes sp. L3-i22]|uniref:hypothetical protein n=1 Tax=Actinoplanes sp. L3-i22 TaxID=2836373 RepID=UPI001C787A8F|nr:hypothetical protein [Actinoplanes sp. L3-i22]BCY12096.1 hypothetical protein L3i22_071840 [Actinoplanes sp. L3-i22]
MRKFWGRVAAGLSVICALAHVAIAWSGLRGGNLALAGVALGMTALCLPCAVRLWRGPTAATWRMTAGMTGVMLALHPSLMTLSGHDHSLHWPALNAVTVTLLLITGTAALLDRTRGNARTAWRLTPATSPDRH